MNCAMILRSSCMTAFLWVAQHALSAGDNFTNDAAIKTFLHDNFDGKNAGMVIGLVDEHGSRVFSAGKLDNGTDEEVNGDAVFEIGSITKTFTDLLLLDMVGHGEVNLDDPVAKYLPKSVKVPARGGKEITLLNLAVQDSGLPFNADNFSSANLVKAYDAYTIEDMYAFLSGYTLPNDPRAKFQYSNLGMSLLGHVMELKAGTNFESLVVNRICHPLHMDSTCIRLTPGLKARAAGGHDDRGRRVSDYHLQVMAPAGALHSTANDLLKYLSANLGLTQTSLTPLMEKMQVIRHREAGPEWGKTAMPWMDEAVYNPPGTELLGHAGGTFGSRGFIGFDIKKHRGVVVLKNQLGGIRSGELGWRILQNARLNGIDPATLTAIHEYVGSGIAVDVDKQTGMLRITKVFPNSPASRADLSAGLIVETINDVPTVGIGTAACVGLMRGRAGTKVQLRLVNPGRSKTNSVELTRQKFLTGD
jgi:serine-type D-Ala-D-Ala carboxypeptidase/endopeptidase